MNICTNKLEIVSACLIGCNCRYDGKCKPNQELIEKMKTNSLLPICPEQLGGLSTPRIQAEKVGIRIINCEGFDVTENFRKGAQEVIRIAQLCGIKKFHLKTRSPMCGCGNIYDGTFSGKLIKGNGVLVEALLNTFKNDPQLEIIKYD